MQSKLVDLSWSFPTQSPIALVSGPAAGPVSDGFLAAFLSGDAVGEDLTRDDDKPDMDLGRSVAEDSNIGFQFPLIPTAASPVPADPVAPAEGPESVGQGANDMVAVNVSGIAPSAPSAGLLCQNQGPAAVEPANVGPGASDEMAADTIGGVACAKSNEASAEILALDRHSVVSVASVRSVPDSKNAASAPTESLPVADLGFELPFGGHAGASPAEVAADRLKVHPGISVEPANQPAVVQPFSMQEASARVGPASVTDPTRTGQTVPESPGHGPTGIDKQPLDAVVPLANPVPTPREGRGKVTDGGDRARTLTLPESTNGGMRQEAAQVTGETRVRRGNARDLPGTNLDKLAIQDTPRPAAHTVEKLQTLPPLNPVQGEPLARDLVSEAVVVKAASVAPLGDLAGVAQDRDALASGMVAPTEGGVEVAGIALRPYTPPSTPEQVLAPRLARQLATAVVTRPNGTDISLSPEELGHVRISIDRQGADITVTLIAERPETLDLMRRHVDVLSNEFRGAGMESCSFQFAQGQEGAAHFGSRENPEASQEPAERADSAEESAIATPSPGGSETVRKGSGVDLRL